MTCKKAAQMLGFLKRNTKEFHSKTKITLFNALVRSILEFACTTWNPFYTIHSQRLENIQRSFTRHLAFISSGISHRSPYQHRLNFFNMDSLYCRRKVQQITFLYKVINGQTDCSIILESIQLSVPTRMPRQPITKIFNIPYCYTNIGLRAPVVQLCNQYNLINKQVPNLDIFSDNYNKFKILVLEYFRQLELEPDS